MEEVEDVVVGLLVVVVDELGLVEDGEEVLALDVVDLVVMLAEVELELVAFVVGADEDTVVLDVLDAATTLLAAETAFEMI